MCFIDIDIFAIYENVVMIVIYKDYHHKTLKTLLRKKISNCKKCKKYFNCRLIVIMGSYRCGFYCKFYVNQTFVSLQLNLHTKVYLGNGAHVWFFVYLKTQVFVVIISDCHIKLLGINGYIYSLGSEYAVIDEDDVVVNAVGMRLNSISVAKLSNRRRPVETVDEDPVVPTVVYVDDSLKLLFGCLDGEEGILVLLAEFVSAVAPLIVLLVK
uniref:Uncharacterized protein n=1 Tax=Glossina brevipalpis TaxID=37001 RepID=A0A1A9W617_9MUSC